MPTAKRCVLPLIVAMSVTVFDAALADRDPTTEERQVIENALRAAGFTSWEEIEFDDDHDDDQVWEIDDAIGADGIEYDLKMDRSFNIIEKSPD
ncbi:MAG: hypothetical protein ACFCUT_20545 [Kiloniellaceae bacterium]